MATAASHLILTSNLDGVGSLLPWVCLTFPSPISHPQIHTAQVMPLGSEISDQLSAEHAPTLFCPSPPMEILFLWAPL